MSGTKLTDGAAAEPAQGAIAPGGAIAPPLGGGGGGGGGPGKRALTDGLAAGKMPSPASVPAEVAAVLDRAQGAPLPEPEVWARRVGADVAHARLVTGEGAPEAAAAMGARAFTVGHRIFFGAGYDASTDGGELLAHELRHVAQQRGAPAPASFAQLPVVAYGDAREDEARSGAAPSEGASEQALARDAETDIDAAAYRKQFAAQIGEGIVAYLTANDLPSGSRFVIFPGPLASGPGLAGATGGPLEAKLDGWLGGKDKVDALVNKGRPMGRQQMTSDGDKTWTEDKIGQGPARWFPDVAVQLAAALHAKLRQSLDRIVPRFIQAAVAAGIEEEERTGTCPTQPQPPAASDIVPSQPIDQTTIAGLIAQARFDLAAYRQTYPKERGKRGALRPLASVAWTAPKNGTYFARVEPADATPEEVSNGLFGAPTQTTELVVQAAPLWGLARATLLTREHQDKLTAMGVDVGQVGDVEKEATTGALADELAKLQGGTGKATTKGAVLRTIDESVAIIATIEKAGASFGMGKNPTVASMTTLVTRLNERRTKIGAAPEAEAVKWAGQVEGQQAVLSSIAFGFDREAKRLADLTKMVTDPALKLGGVTLPPHVREAMNHVAMGFADCAVMSDLPSSAQRKLAEVEDEAGALPITFLEGTLASIQRSLDDAREAKRDGGEHASYDVPGMAKREQELKARLARIRGLIKSSPEAATEELKAVAKLVNDLQTEAEMVTNLDQIDAAWKALDEGVTFWWSSMSTQLKASKLKERGDALHKRWKAVFVAWKSGDPAKQAQAKKDFEELRRDPELGKWIGEIQAVLKSAQIERLISTFVLVIAITVVTAGVGDLVIAGAAGWGLSAGSTAVLAGGAEAAAFTLLSQIFLDSDHSFGHIVYEFGTNWAMFGVMRRFQLFAEVAKLSSVEAAGGNILILAATTYAKADLDKFIREGRHLDEKEIREIALQGMAMAIAMHAVAPKVKPMFAELEGSAYAFASKLRANNRMQETLKVNAEALQSSKSFAKAQEHVAQEKAWLEERLRILDEVEAAAKKEAEGGKPPKDGIAAKLKMSPDELSGLRTELKGHLDNINKTMPLAHLEPKGPGLYTCSRETIRDVASSLGEVQKTTVDPKTTVVSYEVKLPSGEVVTIMEKIDPATDWLAFLRSKLTPEGLAKLEVELKGKTAQQVMDHYGGNADKAVSELQGKPAPSTMKDTLDMFGVGEVPKSPADRAAYKDDPSHWTPERQALHKRLVANAKQQAIGFADATQATGAQPTIYAMRGNTAAGKTRAVGGGVPELAQPMAATKETPHRSINPDNFKTDLIAESGGSLNSDQVHLESSMLADRLQAELLGAKTSDGKEAASMLVDKRLPKLQDVQKYAKLAQDTGRKFELYDVDAPLEVSLAGVLERVPGGADPLPGFDVVATGFEGVRDNRAGVVDFFIGKPDNGNYTLFGTKPDGARVPIATVKEGALAILNEPMYREATAPAGDGAKLLAQKPITEDGIQALTGGMDAERGAKVGNLLRRYTGWTWKAALDAHAAEKPLLQPKAKP